MIMGEALSSQSVFLLFLTFSPFSCEHVSGSVLITSHLYRVRSEFPRWISLLFYAQSAFNGFWGLHFFLVSSYISFRACSSAGVVGNSIAHPSFWRQLEPRLLGSTHIYAEITCCSLYITTLFKYDKKNVSSVSIVLYIDRYRQLEP